MQAYEGYFENGRFYPTEHPVHMPGRRCAFIAILDEPAQSEAIAKRVAALDEFFAAIENSDENVPEFERIKFNRNIDL
jgi:hypothetical protein